MLDSLLSEVITIITSHLLKELGPRIAELVPGSKLQVWNQAGHPYPMAKGTPRLDRHVCVQLWYLRHANYSKKWNLLQRAHEP